MKTGTKYFWGSFLLSSIILTSIFFVATAINGFSETKVEAETAPVAYKPKAKDGLTLLTAITDDNNNGLVFPLIRYSSLSNTFSILTFPAETKVFLDGEGWTMTNVYSKYGISGVKNALSQTYLISTDRTAKATLNNFCSGFGNLGIVEYHLPQAISYEENGVTINISKGMQPLDDTMLNCILTYSLDAEPMNGANILTSIYSETITQKIQKFVGSNAEKMFSLIINNIDTDFSAFDFSTRKEALYYTSQKETITVPIAISGTMIDDSLFIDKECLEKLKTHFNI